MDKMERLLAILEEGEGQDREFKESVNKQLDREIIAFANTSGGSIFIGVNDANKIIGVEITNGLKSQIRDIAHNCDPRINIELVVYKDQRVLEIKVEEGHDKPYRCRDGLYLREGDSTQKLKRDEIIHFITHSGATRFDEAINKQFTYLADFSEKRFDEYLKRCGIKKVVSVSDMLVSLNVAEERNHDLHFTQAGVLFFADNPQKFLPESNITAVKYQSYDRHSIIDRKDINGTLIQQIDDAMQFVMKHIDMKITIKDKPGPLLGQRIETYDYPISAMREVIINAVTHRDYFYDSSHIYIHMYPDRIEVENPGGLFRGMTLDMLPCRSVRRNRLIADLLHRAHYIEKTGSGFSTIQKALEDNNNPPYEISATNFFNLKLLKRLQSVPASKLTSRQMHLLSVLRELGASNTKTIGLELGVSDDTALGEIRILMELGLVVKEGQGKATRYKLQDEPTT